MATVRQRTARTLSAKPVAAGSTGRHIPILQRDIRCPAFKVDGSSFTSSEGSVTVAGSSTKTLVEIKNTDFNVFSGATIRLTAADGTIKLTQVDMAPASGVATAGDVTFEAGTGNAARGALEVLESTISNVTSVSARASAGRTKGVLKFEKSVVSATGNVLMETGSEGKSEEKDNNIVSGTQIRVTSGTGGSCSAGSSTLTAPVVQLCQ